MGSSQSQLGPGIVFGLVGAVCAVGCCAPDLFALYPRAILVGGESGLKHGALESVVCGC